MKNIRNWFVKTGYWMVMKLRLYKFWSKLYRFLFHRKYKKTSINQFLHFDDVKQNIQKLTWTRDGIKEFFDAIGSPHWVQHCLNEIDNGKKQPKGALDCDDYAVWCAHALIHGYKNRLLSVVYEKPDGSIGGHMICMNVYSTTENKNNSILYTYKMAHLGNWGVFTDFKSIEDVIDHILSHGLSSPEKRKLLGYAIMHPQSLSLEKLELR